ncbi:MAG TPA: cytochrome c biogenesis protein ResB [Bdellovibrionota bacterium]|jgi:hypothetical protein
MSSSTSQISWRKRLYGAAYAVFEIFASLELAVILILSLAVILAVGTVYESKYGAAVASREVYRSVWMQLLLWVFMLNLSAVAISRLPWKRHHIGFLVTHLGIITLLLGSWITQRSGVDGTLVLAPGESGRMARIDENMLYVFRTVAGKAYELVLSRRMDFDQRRPLEKPLVIPFSDAGGAQEINVLRYLPKTEREVRAEDVPQGMPALRFQLAGSRATFSDWLFLQADTGATREVGPAVFRFVGKKPELNAAPDKATVVLYMEGDPKLPPKLAVARSGQKFRELGRVSVRKPVTLGWMDFQFLLEEFHPSALPQAEYKAIEGMPPPGVESFEVVEVGFGKQKLWLELGSAGQVPMGDALYYVQYAQRQVDFGFDLKLKNFQVGFYEGTNKAMSYSSEVEYGAQAQTISMNEPLHHMGYTFYQSSYQADPDGTPRFSVFSVNLDPGRWVKYLGSLMTVLGIVSMFYFRPIYSGKSRWLKKKEESEA